MRGPVLDKVDFYKRWKKGEFGNRLRSFDSLAELLDSGYSGNVGIRYKIPQSKFMKYDVPLTHVESVLSAFEKQGARRNLFTYNEMAPDQFVTMQGELQQAQTHYHLRYSTAKMQMRPALLKQPQHAFGLKALALIKKYTDPSSYEFIQELIDTYDNHIIEFSCYSINLGDIPHRNTLIWEVRNY